MLHKTLELEASAGEIALDCISASLCTIARAKLINNKAVRVLKKKGFMDDAAALSSPRCLLYCRCVGLGPDTSSALVSKHTIPRQDEKNAGTTGT